MVWRSLLRDSRGTAIGRFAVAALQEGLEIARTTGEHGWDAELHGLTGAVQLAENGLNEGEAALQRAIHIAQTQQAKSPELRAVRDLARLWGEQSQRANALDLLAPVYGCFTEGFDTADLKDAKALLNQLARDYVVWIRSLLRRQRNDDRSFPPSRCQGQLL